MSFVSVSKTLYGFFNGGWSYSSKMCQRGRVYICPILVFLVNDLAITINYCVTSSFGVKSSLGFPEAHIIGGCNWLGPWLFVRTLTVSWGGEWGNAPAQRRSAGKDTRRKRVRHRGLQVGLSGAGSAQREFTIRDHIAKWLTGHKKCSLTT